MRGGCEVVTERGASSLDSDLETTLTREGLELDWRFAVE